MPKPNSYRAGPDESGHFGMFGGRFVAETLMPLILELEAAYEAGVNFFDNAEAYARGRSEEIMGEDAAPPGATKKTWDAASPKQIQALIDANPALFAQKARVLEQAGDSMVKAADTKDVQTLYAVSSDLDEVCDGCHKPFWGTDEPPPVSK